VHRAAFPDSALAPGGGDLKDLVAAVEANEDRRAEFQRRAPEMLALLEQLGRTYLDQNEDGREGLDQAVGGAWLRDLAARLKGQE